MLSVEGFHKMFNTISSISSIKASTKAPLANPSGVCAAQHLFYAKPDLISDEKSFDSL